MLAGESVAPSAHYPLGPALGQCCGGAVTLAFSRLDDKVLSAWPRTAPRFHLQLYGAGHVGRAIARLLATLDVRLDWIDERDEMFAPDVGRPWPSHFQCLAVDAVEAEVPMAPPGAFYLVLTHSHDLDQRIAEAILRRGDFGFFGLIGSASKRQRFVHRFEQRGLDPTLIGRMSCPIGIDGIAAKEPELIAVGVVAQLLQRAAPV
jgi:xanthine dehydrogenase accessory factor